MTAPHKLTAAEETVAEGQRVRHRTPAALVKRLAKFPAMGIASLVILLGILLVALIGPLISYDPIEQSFGELLTGPSSAHWFGTDHLGRDVFSRVVNGARISLFLGIAAVVLAVLIGTTLGLLAGFTGGWLDTFIMRVADLFLAFPPVILAMAVSAALGPNMFNVLIAVSVAWWPEYARLARSVGIVERNVQYVDAARVLGVKTAPILATHVFPAAIPPIVVKATMDVGIAIVFISGLSFIGAGVQPPTPEWGVMISEGRIYMQSAWWISAFPTLAILVTGFSFNLLGESLRDVLDPKQKRPKRKRETK